MFVSPTFFFHFTTFYTGRSRHKALRYFIQPPPLTPPPDSQSTTLIQHTNLPYTSTSKISVSSNHPQPFGFMKQTKQILWLGEWEYLVLYIDIKVTSLPSRNKTLVIGAQNIVEKQISKFFCLFHFFLISLPCPINFFPGLSV